MPDNKESSQHVSCMCLLCVGTLYLPDLFPNHYHMWSPFTWSQEWGGTHSSGTNTHTHVLLSQWACYTCKISNIVMHENPFSGKGLLFLIHQFIPCPLSYSWPQIRIKVGGGWMPPTFLIDTSTSCFHRKEQVPWSHTEPG